MMNKQAIRSTSKDDLIFLHFGLGIKIRNDFGLWEGNRELLADSGKAHPDDVSSILIRKSLEKLRSEQL
ncbi:MAG: DUF6794 domain-containing protein [Ignavibacteria bacterium]